MGGLVGQDRGARGAFGPGRDAHGAILHLFEENADLEPRDVLVMCPDIETYAPLIQAAFDSELEPDDPASPRVDLRVRLADRAIRQVNPQLATISKLIEMSGGRMTATDVLDNASAVGASLTLVTMMVKILSTNRPP